LSNTVRPLAIGGLQRADHLDVGGSNEFLVVAFDTAAIRHCGQIKANCLLATTHTRNYGHTHSPVSVIHVILL
jgi:hypothetical protein